MSDRWQTRAACARSPIDFTSILSMYDDPQHRHLNAKAVQARGICAGCPVLAECQRFSLREDVEGFAGGMTPYERRRWRRRRQTRRMEPAA